MLARKLYWVSGIGNFWVVRHGVTALSTHDARQPAIDAAIDAAKANPPSELLVQGEDGMIVDRRTYGEVPVSPAQADGFGLNQKGT